MFYLICVGILLVIAGILFFTKTPPVRRRGEVIQEGKRLAPFAAIPIALAVVLFILSITAIVGPKQIGVVTTFGAISERTLDSGLHFKAPWQKVHELDGTKITLKFVGENGCIGVRIGDQSIACASVVTRYEVKKDRADTLFADYRSIDQKSDSIEGINEAISDALVRTELTSSLGSVFKDFNPLLTKDAEGEVVAVSGAPDLKSLSAKTQTTLEAAVDDVDVVSVKITFLRVSQQTQNNIEKLQDELAKTRQAVQRIETATKEADANNELAASLDKNPNVLVSKCLDIVGEGKAHLPAGFSCFGGGGSVVIPAGK